MSLESQSIVLGVNLQPLQKDLSCTHFSADVIVIDKRHEALRPLVYRLKESSTVEEMASKPSYLNIVDDLFLLLGEVETIDKKKKMLILSNQITVSYKYLITAATSPSSSLNANEEFLIGVYALIEALKIQKNLPSDLLNSLSKRATLLKKKSLHHSTLTPADSHIMRHLLAKHIQARLDNNPPDLKEVTQRLYEVNL